MKLIIDTKILFSYFWEKSIIIKIINSKKLKLITPAYAIYELNKYKKDIIKKTKLNSEIFNININELKKNIKIVDEKEYKIYFQNIIKIIDPKDIDFFSLCIKENIPLWSNDKQLKNQKQIKVFNTSEILLILKYLKIEF